MMCIIFINILSTVSFDIFIGTVKQIVKFISYLTTVTNSTYSFIPWNTSLYTCIPRSDGIQALQYFLNNRTTLQPSAFTLIRHAFRLMLGE